MLLSGAAPCLDGAVACGALSALGRMGKLWPLTAGLIWNQG